MISQYYKEPVQPSTTRWVLLITFNVTNCLPLLSFPKVSPPDPHLFFNIKRMEIVVVGQFGTSGHVFERVQADPVHAIDGPAGKTQPSVAKD